MRLFLLRHAEATYDAPSDAARELTPKGKNSIRRLCEHLKTSDFKAEPKICHSTLTRAQQTAELFKEGLGLTVPLQEIRGLAPMDDPTALGDFLLNAKDDLMFVGHNPHLSILTAWLLTGDPAADVIDFKKSALLCVEGGSPPNPKRPAGVWVMRWFLANRILVY